MTCHFNKHYLIYKPLIISIANKFSKDNYEYEEFVQLGRIALLNILSKGNEENIQYLLANKLKWYILNFFRQKNPQQLFDDIFYTKDNFFEYLPDMMTDYQMSILDLKLKNYTFKEIASILKISKSKAHKDFVNIKKIIREKNTI